jgi:hypothetical protein
MTSLRSLAGVTAAVAVAACTSPADTQAPAVGAKGAVAVVAAPASCAFGTPTTVAALGILISPSADSASLSDPANLCRQRANETTARLVLWSAGPSASVPFGPGTFAVTQSAAGGFSAFLVRLDGGCAVVQPNVLATPSSTLTLTSVAADRITGRVDLVFADGRTLAGAFDAPVVASTVSPCDMFLAEGGVPAMGCTARTCAP